MRKILFLKQKKSLKEYKNSPTAERHTYSAAKDLCLFYPGASSSEVLSESEPGVDLSGDAEGALGPEAG